MARVNFTERFLAAIKPPDKGYKVIWDSAAPGLGLRIQPPTQKSPRGTRTYIFFRTINGKIERQLLGSELTLEQARSRVSEINGSFAVWKASGFNGAAPLATVAKELTLESLFNDYRQLHLSGRRKGTRDDAEWLYSSCLKPLHKKQCSSITRKEVRELHAKLSDRGKIVANHAVQLLRAIFNWGLDTERVNGENPAQRITFHPKQKRKRYLSPDELARLWSALRTESSADLQDFVNLALMTGARRGDILSMRWTDLALDENRWHVPSETTKTGEGYDVSLMPEVIEILQRRSKGRKSETWVFPSRGVGGHLLNLKASYKRLLQRAGIVGVTQHDLRRTLGSVLAAQGTSLPIIGKSLGHRDMAATAIYSQLDLTPVREAVLSATRVMIALGGKKKSSSRSLISKPAKLLRAGGIK